MIDFTSISHAGLDQAGLDYESLGFGAVGPFTIGGTVSGLLGTGLVLQVNGGDDLAIAADGAFTFATPLANGTAYTVSVLTNPSGPNQTVALSNETGTLAGANVTNVGAACTTVQYTVGGTVSGLLGSGLVLQLNGGDDEAIAADGAYTFDTPIDDGTAYTVTVLTNPSSPNQTTALSNETGTVSGANVTNVNAACTTVQYTVSVTVSGYTTGTLVLQNNGGDDLAVTSDGLKTFATALDDGSAYVITVLTDPGTTSLGSASGTISGANVTDPTATVTGVIPYVTGLLMQLVADDFDGVYTDGQTIVAAWVNRGSGGDLSPTGTPTYETNELNGHSVVRLNGTDAYFGRADALGLTGDQPFTVFIVFKEASQSGSNRVLMLLGETDATEGTRFAPYIDNSSEKIGLAWWGSDILGSKVVGVSNWYIGMFRHVGGGRTTANTTIRMNRVTNVLTGGAAGVLAMTDELCRLGTDQAGTQLFPGDIAEVIVYDHALAAADRDVEDYLATRYGLELVPYTVNLRYHMAADEFDDLYTDGQTIVVSWPNNGLESDLTVAGSPTYETAELNGHSAVRFNGSDAVFKATTLVGSVFRTDLSFFAVVRVASTATNQALLSLYQSAPALKRTTGAVFSWWDSSNSWKDSTFIPTVGTYYLFEGRVTNAGSSGTVEYWANAVAKGSDTMLVILPSWSQFWLGNGGTSFSDIDLCELAVYDEAISDVNRAIVESYLMTKYGLT
jgi:hypothetical protein